MRVLEIICKNLSIETVNRLGGATEALLDVDPGKVRLSKDEEKLSDINKINTEGAVRFSVAPTPLNDAIFVDYYSPITLDQHRKYIDVVVIVEGHPTNFTRLYVTGKTLTEWEVELQLPADHWSALATQKKINTIDYGIAAINQIDVPATWENPKYTGTFSPGGGNKPYAFWLCDWGWADQTQPSDPPNVDASVKVKAVSWEDFRPLISEVYLLKRGFCEIGWMLSGIVFEHEYFLRHWVYVLNNEFYKAADKYGSTAGRVIGRNMAEQSLSVGVSQIKFSLIEAGLSGLLPVSPGTGFAVGRKNLSGIKLNYKWTVRCTVYHNLTVDVLPLIFRVAELSSSSSNSQFTGEVFSEDYTVDIPKNQDTFVNIEIFASIPGGAKAALQLDNLPNLSSLKVRKGFFCKVEPNNGTFVEGDTFRVADCVRSDISLMDCFKGFVHRINGRIETDNDTKTVIVHTDKVTDVYGDDVPGFFKVESESVQINDKVLQSSIITKQIKQDLKRFTRLQFADSTDAYIQSLELETPLYSRTITNGVDLPDETQELTNPLYEPTIEAQPIYLKTNKPTVGPSAIFKDFEAPYLPRMWDNEAGNLSYNIGPRVLVAFGIYEQRNPKATNVETALAKYYFTGYTEGAIKTEIPYATQARTPKAQLNPTPPNDYSIVYGIRDRDLFVNFYLGLVLNNKRGWNIDLLMYMTMKDYAQFDFRSPFEFSYLGRPLRTRMTAIRDFAAGTDEPTPVTFFLEPSESLCCDLPCSCVFRTCTYYQDFGVYMLQATLNSMSVTSFKIDGLEILTAPVHFGLINIVDINGKPFVTNMVDTLNSIGAPYFVFEQSERIHSSKGMRFFTIKWPSCQGFEIIISNGSGELYKYTNTEQKQKQFQAGWDQFGYGGEFYGEPADCVLSKEY